MTGDNDRTKVIEKIINNGYIRHDEIIPVLNQAGMSQINPDEVSDLVRRHRYGGRRGPIVRLTAAAKNLGDKIGGYVSAAIGAGLLAEIMAAKVFAGSLLDDKLQGFGDHFLYWLGLKSVEISGPEMMYAMGKTIEATPKVVKGMVLGVILGYIGWKVITRAIGYVLRRNRRRKEIRDLLARYNLVEGG
jgi:hypothetical protein